MAVVAVVGGEGLEVAAANKATAKGDGDDAAGPAGSGAGTVPTSNRSKTATFPANRDKVCSNCTPTGTDSCAVPRITTPASGAIRSFPAR